MRLIPRTLTCLACAALALIAMLSSCGSPATDVTSATEDEDLYLSFVDSEPETVDPQCIIENYTVALNVFDRLVETEQRDGSPELVPSLAESWSCSDDGLVYRFALRQGVTFSNGAALTASDVKFSFERLLTHPMSRHADLLSDVQGADALAQGETTGLEGFRIEDDYHFSITLTHPAAAFIAGLSTPGASIFDEESTLQADDSFGYDADNTVGSGPFLLSKWTRGKSIVMRANANHWAGAPACAGLKMQFYTESSPLRELYVTGKIDLLDLDFLDMEADYFLRGDAYLENLARGKRVGITYLALNNSQAPLSDVRVRHALALGLDRATLLVGVAGGRGTIENGIFPRGLLGHNDALPEIPYDPTQARSLLAEAGLSDGFDLVISYPSTASQGVRDLVTLTASIWSDIGVRAHLEEVESGTFYAKRNAGKLACYTSTFSADYNDPQTFMETFFGGRAATDGRSICYQDDTTMQKVAEARSILDEDSRVRAYQNLEQKIVQEDYAWIPLYSKAHIFVVSNRVEGFEVRWNGWSSNRYDKVRILGSES